MLHVRVFCIPAHILLQRHNSQWLNYDSYSVVYKCWKVNPDERPSFETLSSTFDEKMQAVAGYLELKMVFESQGGREFVAIMITYSLCHSLLQDPEVMVMKSW